MQALRKLGTVSESGGIARVIIRILVLGSIWGLWKPLWAGPYTSSTSHARGATTGGIAMAIMAAFVVTYGRPRLVFWLGVVAALFKPLSAAIYGQPVIQRLSKQYQDAYCCRYFGRIPRRHPLRHPGINLRYE